MWTREEEFTWAYVRPAGVIDIPSGVRDDGSITAWEFHNYNSGTAGIQTKYDLPNQKVVFHQQSLCDRVRIGFGATETLCSRDSH